MAEVCLVREIIAGGSAGAVMAGRISRSGGDGVWLARSSWYFFVESPLQITQVLF